MIYVDSGRRGLQTEAVRAGVSGEREASQRGQLCSRGAPRWAKEDKKGKEKARLVTGISIQDSAEREERKDRPAMQSCSIFRWRTERGSLHSGERTNERGALRGVRLMNIKPTSRERIHTRARQEGRMRRRIDR